MPAILSGIAAILPHTGRALLSSALLLGIGIAVGTSLLISHLHERALTTTGHELERLALVLAHEAARSIEAATLVQDSLIEHLREVETVEQYRQAVTGPGVQRELRDRIRGLPQMLFVSVVDASGNVLNDSLFEQPRGISVADREFFTVLAADPQRMSFLSEPIRNRTTGAWTIYLARKLVAPDGTFLGLILGGLDQAYYDNLYAAAGFGDGSFAALFRQDGTQLAGYPRLASATVVRAAVGTDYQRLLAAGSVRDLMRINLVTTGEDSLVAIRLAPNAPMLVSVGMTVRQALVEWRAQAAYLLAAALLLELVIIGIGLLMLRHLRAQRLLAEATIARGQAEAALRVAHERETADVQARIQDARFGAALANMSQGLMMFDADNRIVVVNDRLSAIYGLPPGAIVPGGDYETFIDFLVANCTLTVAQAAETRGRIGRLIARGKQVSYVRELDDGRSIAGCLTPMKDGWLLTYEDITERRQAEAQIAHMAHHDALTGLPNRVLFHQRLEEVLARSRREEQFSLLCLDLDRFKAVNDTLGHPIGDALLRAVTGRLLLEVRETDTVARLGGDEFAIIQTGADQPNDATALSQRLIAALSAPYLIKGHSITIGTSIGIAMLPGDGADADTLLKNADLALYRAKSDRRGTFCFFEPGMDARMQARRTLELELRQALPGGEFELFYQPIMTLCSRTLSGFEALIRWRHPTAGLLSPDTFIPLAEEIGLIVPIGEWVLQRACADAAGWPAEVKVAVNCSAAQFVGSGLVPAVRAALAASGLDPARLELEITETVMLDDTDATLQTLRALKALGVTIAMDDFGTGYSSLSYLRKFPFDRVKIDRSFISDLSRTDESVAIIQAVTGLCEALGMATTAEGVETEAQLQGLASGHCTDVQGYLFGAARPAADVPAMCQELGTSLALTGSL